MDLVYCNVFLICDCSGLFHGTNLSYGGEVTGYLRGSHSLRAPKAAKDEVKRPERAPTVNTSSISIKDLCKYRKYRKCWKAFMYHSYNSTQQFSHDREQFYIWSAMLGQVIRNISKKLKRLLICNLF